MKKLLKSYWFTKVLILVFLLSIGIIKTNAQHTFFLKIPAFNGYDPSVIEDEKGCIVAKYDFGLTRINTDGRILWQTGDIGAIKCSLIKDSNSYISPSFLTEFGGYSIQSIDYYGKQNWFKSEKFNSNLPLRNIHDFIIDSVKKQYVVVGSKSKIGDFKDFKYWIAGLDFRGNIIWESTWQDSGASRYFIKILKNRKTKGYMLLTDDFNKSGRTELFSLDTLGRLLARNFPEPKICKGEPYDTYRISRDDFCEFGEGFLGIIGISSTSPCTHLEAGAYFYVYDYTGKEVERKRMIEENSIGIINSLPNGDVLGFYSDSILRNGIKVLSNKLETKWQAIIPNLPTSDVITGYHLTYSRDGGFIGIVSENAFLTNEYFAYVFKTDSLGNINQKEEYLEKLQPLMLQPNPANNQVRIAIPYYYGTVTVEFYTMLGEFLFKKTKSEQDIYDISSLSPGMYIVKARIEETGELRTMRLIVQ
jgi:hypothetical protein